MAISITQAINKAKIGGADKVSLQGLFTAMQADIEQLRAAQSSLLAKLDANHGAAADHVSTLNVPASKLNVTK